MLSSGKKAVSVVAVVLLVVLLAALKAWVKSIDTYQVSNEYDVVFTDWFQKTQNQNFSACVERNFEESFKPFRGVVRMTADGTIKTLIVDQPTNLSRCVNLFLTGQRAPLPPEGVEYNAVVWAGLTEKADDNNPES